jgi:hypothetical protein
MLTARHFLVTGAAGLLLAGAQVQWSATKGPVPGAVTSASPALTSVTFPGQTARTFLAWAGPASGGALQISYEYSVSLAANRWSPRGTVDGGAALTSTSPAAATFPGTSGREVIVVWKGPKPTDRVFYSIGTAQPGGKVTWGKQAVIPGSLTTTAPAVYSPLHSKVVLVAWKAAGGTGIDDVTGSPAPAGPGGVSWGPVGTIPNAATSVSPALAEASTGTDAGRVYALWRGTGSAGRIFYATTADPVASPPRWTAPAELPAGRGAGSALTAISTGPGHSYPLLLAFRALTGTALIEETLTRNGKAGPAQVIPSISSGVAPALFGSVLGATSPKKRIRYKLRRICGGC